MDCLGRHWFDEMLDEGLGHFHEGDWLGIPVQRQGFLKRECEVVSSGLECHLLRLGFVGYNTAPRFDEISCHYRTTHPNGNAENFPSGDALQHVPVPVWAGEVWRKSFIQPRRPLEAALSEFPLSLRRPT